MKTRRHWILFGCALALGATACIQDDGDFGEAGDEDVMSIEFGASSAVGTYRHAEQALTFESEVFESAIEVTIEMRGMILLMTLDRQSGVFDLDGYAADNGQDTQLLDEDTALLRRFEHSLTETYQANQQDSPALDYLNRALTMWGQYAPSLPLQRTFYGRLDQSSSLCSSVNKPGQGAGTKKWISATHDCNDTAGDCSNWWGCSRWDDNATTNNVFMSMHPDGGCSDDTYFGGSSTSFSCHEPDHPGGKEYAYGGCFGRCGAACGSGTVFTRDCLDHDQCVRLGHSTASFWCGDELTGATWDTLNGSNCSGVSFSVDYDWTNSSNEGNCPTGWNGTNDGCDHGCQFIDGDCFR